MQLAVLGRLAISPAQAKRQPETTSTWMHIAIIQCSASKPSGSTGRKRPRNAPRPELSTPPPAGAWRVFSRLHCTWTLVFFNLRRDTHNDNPRPFFQTSPRFFAPHSTISGQTPNLVPFDLFARTTGRTISFKN